MARPGIAAGDVPVLLRLERLLRPLLYTSENKDNWTVSLGLAGFRSIHHVEWQLVSAAALLTMLPIVVLFFFAQKAFVEGVTLTGVRASQ